MAKTNYKNLISEEIRRQVLSHVEKTLAISNRRPAKEIADALLSWKRAQEHLKTLENIIGSVRTKKMLEIGSGFGLFLTLSLNKGAKAYGIEPAKNKSYEQTLEISRKILKKAGYSSDLVRSGFGEKLPYKDSTFDLVVSFYTLEHVKNVQKVIKESSRVLKPGGYIFFEVPNYGSFWEGHYGIPWIPYIPKILAKFYVLLWGKEGKLLDELQLVNALYLRSVAKNLNLEIVDMGKDSFKSKVKNLNEDSIGTLGSASKILNLLKKLRLLDTFVFFANLLEAQTPIIFVVKKNVK